MPGLNDWNILARTDSAYYGRPSSSAALNAGADVSVTARMSAPVARAIATIPDNRWQTIQYPDAIVAEVPFTAFSS